MKRITSPIKIKDLGTIMGIWAHPDDESFMTAGLMAAAIQNGQTVACITATKGEAGSQDETKWPSSTLGEVRAKELAKAFEIIGIKNHHWLNYPDGGCCDIAEEEAVNNILKYIQLYQPDTVITFPPDGITGHWDHVSISGWTKMALERFTAKPVTLYYGLDTQEQYDTFMRLLDEKFNIFFNIDKPSLIPMSQCDIVLELTPELAQLKHQVLAAMPSQTEAMLKAFSQEFMEAGLSTEAFINAERQQQWGSPTKK